MTKLLKIILLSVLAVGLLSIGVYLFFGNKIIFYLENSNIYSHGSANEDKAMLSIGYLLGTDTFDPTSFNVASRQYVVDIYEGLVRTDKDLNIQTGLAISWGVVRDNIWEFRLRPNVMFHDGRKMTADDVVYSIELAQTSGKSELSNLISNIKSVKALSEEKIQIETSNPDPLLLNKLAAVFIVPDQYNDFDNPVGTGPYKLIGHRKDQISLERFDQYWSVKPVYKNVDLKVIPGRKERVDALEKGDIDILGNVPPNVACSLTKEYAKVQGCSSLSSTNIQIKTIPSLEVSFLMLNMKNLLLKDVEIRSAMKQVFDYSVFKDLAFGFTVRANQFVSNGVFGYNPEISDVEYDLEDAKKVFEKKLSKTFDRPLLTFDYPIGLEPIGIYLRDQLREVGVDVVLNAITPAELESKVKSGKSDMYFFGWKSELGDSADFLYSVAHSKDDNGNGIFNGIGYNNQKVDELTSESRGTMDPAKRIRYLQDAMKIIVDDDVIGIPLFESEIIYAFKNSIEFTPRIDGYIVAAEIK